MADDQDRINARAEALTPEEEEAGSDDPVAQAAAILEESDEREFERDDPTGQGSSTVAPRTPSTCPDLDARSRGDQAPKP